MFFRGSRYSKLSEEQAPDARGRLQRSKALRLDEPAEPVLQHVLQETDRLDHLAASYYKDSRKWWRICDANPEILSPLRLVGQDGHALLRLQLASKSGQQDRLHELLGAFRSLAGIEDVFLESVFHSRSEPVFQITERVVQALRKNGVPEDALQELQRLQGRHFIGRSELWSALDKVLSQAQLEAAGEAALIEARKIALGEPVTVHLEEERYRLTISWSRAAHSEESLSRIATEKGFVVEDRQVVDRIGTPINIPSRVIP